MEVARVGQNRLTDGTYFWTEKPRTPAILPSDVCPTWFVRAELGELFRLEILP